MKHFLIFVAFLSFAGKLFAVDYDSVLHVISDRTKPFNVRYEAAIQHFDYFSAEQSDVLENEMKSMLREAKHFEDKTPAIHLYGNIAVLLWIRNVMNAETAKHYLDSAMVYEKHASELGKAKLYIVAGTYYTLVGEHVTGHEYFYKSIAGYEKVGGYFDERVIMLHNIAAHYSWQKDTASFRKVLEKMRPLAKQANTFKSDFFFNNALAAYYYMFYAADKQQFHYADSMRACYSRIIQRFEKINPPPKVLKRDVAYIYYYYANNYTFAEAPDMDMVYTYTQKAMDLDTANLQLKLMCYMANANGYTKLHRYDRALEWAMKALHLTEQPNLIEEAQLSEIYELLSKIHAGRKDFEQALKFEKLYHEMQSKINNKERSQMVKELETRYEVAKKEESIQHLTEQNRYRQNINRLYLGMLVLIALVCVFVILWFRNKRKADANKLQITKLQSYLEGLESERSRLAKEMHDHVSNGLLALEIKMQSSGVPDELTAMANSLHHQVREISHALIPPVFQYASLPEIIDDYVRKQNGLEGPCFQFYLTPEEGWEQLPHQTALDLYRIVQEACSNAIKHAGAKNVVISLSRKENQMELSVTDDGCGFQTAEITKGIGLQTINERAANQNGIVTIDSSPRKGTTVQLIIDN